MTTVGLWPRSDVGGRADRLGEVERNGALLVSAPDQMRLVAPDGPPGFGVMKDLEGGQEGEDLTGVEQEVGSGAVVSFEVDVGSDDDAEEPTGREAVDEAGEQIAL